MKVMSLPITRGHLRALRQPTFAVLLSLFASHSFAQRPAEGPFAALPGSWSGTGIIALLNGTKERIRCRAAYRLGTSSVNLALELSCASDSYKFELQSNIAYSDQSISGSWFEINPQSRRRNHGSRRRQPDQCSGRRSSLHRDPRIEYARRPTVGLHSIAWKRDVGGHHHAYSRIEVKMVHQEAD